MVIIQRITLVALLTCVGLFAGLAVGAAFFVPADSSLAGPAIALMWGFGGGAIALVGGVITARRLEQRSLRRALLIAAALVAAIAAWIGFRISVVSAAPAAQAASGVPSERVDLLTFAQGAIPVRIGGSGAALGVSFESAMRAIDGNPGGFGLSQKPGTADTDLEFVYQLPAPTTFDRFAVPNVLETPSPTVTFTRLVEVDRADVGMIQCGQNAGFALEACQSLWIG